MTAAYEKVLAALKLNDRGDPLAELVAKKVIDIAHTGEDDPDRIAARVLRAIGQRPVV